MHPRTAIPTDFDDRDLDELLEYWDRLICATAGKRTSLTSGLIPVREYVAFSGVEAWRRWPEIYRRIDAAVPAEELGTRMRGPGTATTNAHPFALATIPLGGWRAVDGLSSAGLIEPVEDPRGRLRTIFDFWVRFAEAWRADGFRQCYDAADSLRSCDAATIEELYAGAVPIRDDDANRAARRLVAGLQQFLFLLYLDTRLGTGDSGPYPLPNGRHMIVREFSALTDSWIPWGDTDLPHRNLVCGLVFRPGVHNRVNDLSSTFSEPADNLSYLESLSVFEPGPDGTLTEVPHATWAALTDAVLRAQKSVYRTVAGWTKEEKVRNGAFVYFRGLLWPFTSAAGIDDDIDWTVPGPGAEDAFAVFAAGLPEDPAGDQVTYPMLPRLSAL